MTASEEAWNAVVVMMERAIDAAPTSKERADAMYDVWILAKQKAIETDCVFFARGDPGGECGGDGRTACGLCKKRLRDREKEGSNG
jgi:hypothetical protein